MKNCAVIFGICSLSMVGLSLGNPPPMLVGRTVYHADDSRTESVSDPNVREMTESTYNTSGQLTVKKVFLLNEKGDPLQGNVYDGRGNLVARVRCIYDEFGRRKEDQLTNLNGEVFQQVQHEYGKDGKALPPKVINLNPTAAPSLRPAAVDFTQQQPAPNSSRFAPMVQPEAGQQPIQPQQPASPPPAPQEEKPKNFFKKLFKK